MDLPSGFAGLVALMLLGLARYYWKHRIPEPEPAVVEVAPMVMTSPYEEAIDRLHKLETVDLAHQTDIKPFYVELSELLRTYLSQRMGLAAMEQTTRELVYDLKRKYAPPGTVGFE